MSITDLTSLLKKKGFRDTYHILASKNFKCEKHAFYNELNKFSYYNSFFRIKDELIKRGLLEIKINDGKKYITLTKRGVDVYNKLIEIKNLIDGK